MTSKDPVRVTVVTAPACHFCEDAQAVLAELAQDYPLVVRLVAADSGEGKALLHAHRAGMFPLVLVSGAFFSAGRLPRRKLAWLLARKAPERMGGLAMGNLLASGSVLAAFFAGGVALFAPCCIVFLAPGYLALAAKNHRWRLLPLTFTFTAGLALVLVPITVGISLVAASIARFHAPLYYAGGTLMLALAGLALSGRMWSMPRFLPAPDASRGDSASFFAFGVFSGIASSCCAPVLAGVMTLSALSGTPGGGVVLGLAYVFGMVFPLFVMALAWDKLHLSDRRLLRARPVRLHFAGRFLVTSTVNIMVAAGFAAMAGFVFYLAGAGRMTGGPGFQVAIGRALAHLFRRIEIWTAPVPEPVLGLALLVLAAGFTVAALHGRHRPDLAPDPHPGPDRHPDPGPGVDPDAAGQPPAPAGGETHPGHAPPGHKAAADHHCHAPVRNQP